MNGKKIAMVILVVLPLLLRAQTDSVPNVENLLSLSLEQLMDIKVVTASGYLQTTAEAPSTIQVVTSQQIHERGYEQLEDVLRDIPGIDMIHLNGYAPTLIYFRGMYGAENLRALLMIDGVVENNILGSNDMAGPAYSLHNVDRIEIIWGPASALYGANAFGGIINIISKKGSEINGLHAETGYGTFNTTVTRMSMGARRNNFDLSFSGSMMSSEGPAFRNRDPLYDGSYIDKAFSFIGTVSHYAKRSKTTLSYRMFKTPSGWGTYANSPTRYLRLPSQGNNNTGESGVLTREFNGEKGGYDAPYLGTIYLQHDFNVKPNLSFMARLVYRETGYDEDSYLYISDTSKMYRVKIATWSNRVSGELTGNYFIGEKHRFYAGLQFVEDNVEAGIRQTTFDPTFVVINGKDSVANLGSMYLPRVYDVRKNFGSYLQYVLSTKLLRQTEFTAGLRYDNNSYFGSAISPRLVVVNHPTDKITIKLQFGHAFRAPGNLEIYQAPSSFDLTTEKITTYEVNAIYSRNKNLRFQLNAFRNEMRDVIALGSLAGPSPNKNPGLVNTNGVEAILNYSIDQKTYGFFNATLQEAKGENLVTGTKGDIPGIAKFKANAGLTTNIADLFSSTLTINWVGKRHEQRTNPYGPVAGYMLANIAITSKPLFKERITAGLTIHNLFNTTWYDPGFRTAEGTFYSTVLEQPGATVLFKLAVHLSNTQ